MKVYNHSQLIVEKAKKTKCPRCSGFGACFGDDGSCNICNGHGSCWISKSGWTRAINTRLEKSKLH